jgi:hypothetical protein
MKRPGHSIILIATAATLGVALSAGSAAVGAALAKNSVGSAQIKSQAVKSSDVKNDALKGKDIKESSLGTVPRAQAVDSVLVDARATAGVNALTTVHVESPFTITLGCVNVGGGSLEATLRISTSADNASVDSLLGSDDANFDVVDGPQAISQDSGNPAMEHLAFAAVAPNGQLLQGIGYIGSKLNGANSCVTQLTFLG